MRLRSLSPAAAASSTLKARSWRIPLRALGRCPDASRAALRCSSTAWMATKRDGAQDSGPLRRPVAISASAACRYSRASASISCGDAFSPGYSLWPSMVTRPKLGTIGEYFPNVGLQDCRSAMQRDPPADRPTVDRRPQWKPNMPSKSFSGGLRAAAAPKRRSVNETSCAVQQDARIREFGPLNP